MGRPNPEDVSQPGPLRRALQTLVTWTRTDDVHQPLSAVVDGEAWTFRLGDFPAEPLYILLIDGEEVGSFDTWPAAWTRPTA